MRNILYIIILAVVTGCGFSEPKTQELDEAERLLPSDPAAALERLNGMDVSEIRDSSTMARWALLYGEAMVANRLSAPTDTIINIAMDYYGSHDLRDEFQKASRLKALMTGTDNRDELAVALYLQKEKEFFLYKERARRDKFVFAGIIILLAASGVIAAMYQRLRLKSAQNDLLVSQASDLKCRIEAQNSDVGRLESTLHGLLDKRFTLIDSLCQTYYESQGTKTERKAIAEKVKSEIAAVRTDYFPDMEQAVNDCRDNLLIRIKTAYPGIKNDEYQLTVFLAAGLSARTISLLLGESIDVVYKRKSRLKGRLKAFFNDGDPTVMWIFGR